MVSFDRERKFDLSHKKNFKKCSYEGPLKTNAQCSLCAQFHFIMVSWETVLKTTKFDMSHGMNIGKLENVHQDALAEPMPNVPC